MSMHVHMGHIDSNNNFRRDQCMIIELRLLLYIMIPMYLLLVRNSSREFLQRNYYLKNNIVIINMI